MTRLPLGGRLNHTANAVHGTRYVRRRTRYAVCGTLLLLLAPPLKAQARRADSLWAAENYGAARVEYTRLLHQDPGSVRALYRLAILTAWDGKLDSALALLRDAREVEPSEPDVRLWEAKVMAWRGRYGQALARYDSVIVEFPERRDARLGRAQTLAWAGRQREADHELRDIVAADPEYAEALFMMAQLRLWQERLSEADHYNEMALRVAPQNRAGHELQREIIALRNPRVEVVLGVSHDSDKNNAWWQTFGTSLVVAPGVRGFANFGAYEADDPIRNGTRLSAELGATWHHGNLGVTGALGGRKISTRLGKDRDLAIARAGVSYRLAPDAGIGVGYAHYSFDETALLLSSNLDIDEFSADGDVEILDDLTLGVGLGAANLSDGNRRRSVIFSASQRLGSRFTAGLFTRGVWYRFRGTGYFSPDHFLLAEVRGSYTHVFPRWTARLGAGVGLQHAGTGATTDGEWRVDLKVARRWATINEIAVSGGISNSAISSATGAFHYYTAAISARIGL